MKKLIVLTILVSVIISCKSQQKETSDNEGLPFTIIDKGSHSGKEEASELLITNYNDLKALYEELNLQDVPQVNFNANNVAALFMGQQRNGGYSITVKKVVYAGNDTATAVIMADTTKPEKGEMVTMALTSPYCIALIPKTEKADFQYSKK